MQQRRLEANFETKRLALREARLEDAYAFRDFMCEPAFWTKLPIDPPGLSSIRASIEQSLRDAAAAPRTAWSFAAIETETGRIVGKGSLRVLSWPWRQGEIGWGVDPNRAGVGFGTEVAASLLDFAFVDLGLHRILARCRPDNAGSRQLMARLGFREEGIAREDVIARGEWWDSLQAAILDHEWRGREREAIECRR